jgi:hypothetical protein
MDPRLFILLFLTITWAGPVGLGFLLAGLGVFYWGQAQKAKAEQK